MRFKRLTAGGDRLIHFRSGDLPDRKSRRMLRPERKAKRQMYHAVKIRRDLQSSSTQMRRRLAQQRLNSDRSLTIAFSETVSGCQGASVHVQRLAVVADFSFLPRKAVQPRETSVPSLEVDVRPAGDSGGSRD